MKPLRSLALLILAVVFLGCADGGPVGTGISSSSVSGMVVSVDTTAGGGAASNQDGKVFVIVKAGISHAAAIEIQRMIQERTVTIGRRLHSLEEV